MFQLTPQPKPSWQTVAPGIRLELRHGPVEAMVFARKHVRDVLKADPTSDWEFALVCGMAIWSVTAWDGVGTEGSDEPAPLTADNLVALLRQHGKVYDAVDDLCLAPALALEAEGNGSGVSSNGTSMQAPASAKDAEISGSPAPTVRPGSMESSAPMSSTSLEPKPETASGPSSDTAPAN